MAVFVSKQWIFLNRLTPYLQKHAKQLVLGFICIVFTAVFVLASPCVMGKAADSLYESITQVKFLRYELVIIGLTALAGIFSFGMRYKLYQLQYKDQEVDV
jgi:ABC-type multidrug transport system fused ATPase/permease subunit